jgi:chromosome segregation ATPase
MSNDLVIRLCDERALLMAELETLRSVHADAQAELVKLKAELVKLKAELELCQVCLSDAEGMYQLKCNDLSALQAELEQARQGWRDQVELLEKAYVALRAELAAARSSPGYNMPGGPGGPG